MLEIAMLVGGPGSSIKRDERQSWTKSAREQITSTGVFHLAASHTGWFWSVDFANLSTTAPSSGSTDTAHR